jgi:hypothetical protein
MVRVSIMRPPSVTAPRHAVATAADRDLQVVLSRELHGIRDIGGVLASDDDGRALVDHAVVDLTHLVVGGIDRSEDLARDCRPQLVNRLLRNRTARHCTPSDSCTGQWDRQARCSRCGPNVETMWRLDVWHHSENLGILEVVSRKKSNCGLEQRPM